MKTLSWILLTVLTAHLLNAQKYSVHFSIPEHVGEIWAFSASSTDFNQASRAGNTAPPSESQINFEGRAEALEVDANGQTVKMAFTVQQFTKVTGGVIVELLKPRSVIIADVRQTQPISLEGGFLDESVRTAFRSIYSPSQPGSPTDDELFGMTGAKAIGESWSINIPRAYADLKEKTGMNIPPGHLSGTVTLVSKGKIGTVDCLNLRAEIRADGLTKEDPEFTLDAFSVRLVMQACLPVEGSANSSRKTSLDNAVKLRGSAKDGVKVEMNGNNKLEAIWMTIGN